MIDSTLQSQGKTNITTINNEREVEEDDNGVVKLHHKND